MKKGFSHKMNLAIKKLVIGTLVAGFLLLPVSVTFEKKYEDIFGVRMQKNEALANVESMNIAVTNTTSSQASITITVSGPLDSGETLHITLYKENLAALGYSPIEGKDFTASYTTPPDQTISYVYSYNFDPDTTYFLLATNVGASKIIASNTVSFKGDGTNINNDVQSAGNNPNAGNQTTQPKKNSGYGFECGIGVFGYSLTGGSIGGCFAAIFYYVWVLTGSVMHLAGRFLDFFVYYSTNSDSYTGAFVEKGWGVVRDVSNLFFIIALLFVAFKVIMNDSHSNPQKLVGMIIMMALLINFSLFATRVVIDASNILAKIFYNNITSKDENGELVNNANGEKSISVGLVQKFNPQNVISKDTYNTENGIYEFIFVTFILILITGYCAWIFFSVSFLFVARVVSLWLAMIFSPIAFASNTVSFNMGSLGYSKWSSELFRNAMLAPLFIFFLYLIVLFLDAAGSTLTYTGSTDLLDNIMHVIIPFMILVGLLQKAKEFAEEYAGKMGDTINKVGGMVTGAALGATAVAGRATIGRLGNYVAESDWAKQAESRGVLGARTLRNLGKAAGTGSMDIRGIAIAGQSITSADLGRAKTGGWAQTTHEKVAARQKRAEELKVGHGEHLTHDLHTAEEKHQNILRNDVVDTKGNEMGSAQKLDQIKAFTDSNKEKQQEWNNKAKNVDTVDAKKKGEQQEALKKAQEMSEVDEEARSKKRLAIQSAQAMIVTDHQKVKEKIDA